VSDTFTGGRILKASTVQLRRTDPHTVPVEVRIAEAEQAAYRAGYEQGYTAGALEAGATLADSVARMRQDLLAGLDAHRADVRAARAADADQLIELALAVAEWAVRRELSTVPDVFFARLAEVLAERDRHDRVEIATSPSMVAATRQWLDDEEIRVVAADDLDDGEARVSIGDTTIFATFAEAFERAREVIDTLVAEAHHDDDGSGGTVDPDDLADDGDVEVEVLYDAFGDGAR